MKCVKGHEIKPMKSAAGWYMGTSEDGMPYCRITAHYYESAKEAEKHMLTDYRYCEENNFCSRGRSCYEW